MNHDELNRRAQELFDKYTQPQEKLTVHGIEYVPRSLCVGLQEQTNEVRLLQLHNIMCKEKVTDLRLVIIKVLDDNKYFGKDEPEYRLGIEAEIKLRKALGLA